MLYTRFEPTAAFYLRLALAESVDISVFARTVAALGSLNLFVRIFYKVPSRLLPL